MTATDPEVFRHGRAAEGNRRRKAVPLAVVLRQEGHEAAPDSPRERRRLERAAGVRRSSDDTWDLAVRIAAWQDRVAERTDEPPWWDGFGGSGRGPVVVLAVPLDAERARA